MRRAFVWCRDTTRAMEFAARMSAELGFEVCATSDLLLTGRTSDVIVTCTPARKWFLGRMHVRPGAFVAAVGADSPDKQEIEPALLAEASVITDFTGQSAHVGDLHHAIAAGLMTEQQVRGDLGGVVTGAVQPRRRIDETVIFDSTGTALQDVATAALVYERAVAAKRGVRFPFWG